MAFLYGDVILTVLFLAFAAMFLFVRKRSINILSGLGIIILCFLLDLPLLLTLLIGAVVSMISFNYLRDYKAVAIVLAFFLLPFLLVPAAVAAPPNDTGPPFECPPAFGGEFVKEVGSVKNQPGIDVHGTNYLVGDIGKVMVFLSVGNYPIDNAACFVNVLKPDMSFFIQNDLMLHYNTTSTEFQGLYYYDFTVPNITGVFPVEAYCFYNSTELIDYPDSYISNITLWDGELDDLRRFDDGAHMSFQGDGNCNGVNCQQLFSIPVQEGGAEEFLTSFRINAGVWTNKQRIFYFYIRDYDADEWVYWFNITKNVPVNPTQYFMEINESFIQDGGLNLLVKINVSDFDNGDLDLYHIYASRIYNGSYVGELRGSNEIVVSAGGQFQYQIITGDEPIIDATSLFTILFLIVAVGLLLFGFYIWTGFAFILWVILFSTNTYISLIIVGIGLILILSDRFRKKE